MRGLGSVSGAACLGFAAFSALLGLTEPAAAQDFTLVTTLVHPNPRPINEDRFGCAVAISGDTLFVGAKDEQGTNDYSGGVHVFSGTDWSEVARLKSSVDADFEFGSIIRLDGERALISNAAIDSGVIWLFERVAGVWTEKLRAQGVVNEAFGYALALRGDFAFIAAARVGTGSVHVYRRVAGNWGEVQVLAASDAQDGDFFGYSISFDGQRLAVAAPGNLLAPKRSGVYTFSRVGDGFVQDGELAGDDPANNWFGAEVAVSGDTLVVSAPPAYQASSSGKALVYARHDEQWQLDKELTIEGEKSFPQGVVLDGDVAWFGSSTSEPKSKNIYEFQHANGGWQQIQKLSFPVPGENELTSWGFQNGTLAIGFWNGLRTESVQVYRGPGYQASGGSASGGAASAAGEGTVAAGGRSGSNPNGGSPAGGVSAGGVSAGGGAGPANAGEATSIPAASAGQGGSAEQAGGCGCTSAPRANTHVWWLAALTLAAACARKRRRFRGDAG